MKEIALFLDSRMQYQASNLIKILTQNKSIRLRIIDRKNWTGYDFKNCAVAVTTDPIGHEMVTAMQSAKNAGVPSLAIQDGIVEYEHCWKKRLDRYRPLITDRIAVFGRFTKQILISWGLSPNKIDIVGCPRFDSYAVRKQTYPSKPTILLTSANTPYVDDKTKEQFRLSFMDTAKELENSGVNYFIRLNRKKTLTLFANESIILKRLRTNQQTIAKNIGHRPAAFITSIVQRVWPDQFTITQDISDASAVITSISTVALEAMAMGRPVAILNYSGETIYHRTPWEITSPRHIKSVVQELLNPPSAKLLFQNQLFSDYVLYDSSASRRVADLITNMMTH